MTFVLFKLCSEQISGSFKNFSVKRRLEQREVRKSYSER